MIQKNIEQLLNPQDDDYQHGIVNENHPNQSKNPDLCCPPKIIYLPRLY